MKKLFSILLTLVLLVSFSLVTAAPASAGITDYTTAVLDAADNLVVKQSDDGGFDWIWDDNLTDSSADNCLGITAIGILKGYELEEKASYETALAKAYGFAVNTAPTYAWDDNKWTEKTTGGGVPGVESFPDVTFMVWLAEAAADDVSLLGAIQTQVSGTTAASIAALAKERWDDRVLYLGSGQQSPLNGTATSMAEYIRDARHGQNLDALIPWDLEAAVKAALALDAYYPGEGYDTQAISIVTVIYTSVDDAGGTYFNSGDTSQKEYVLGLTGAIEAFVEVGVYPEKVAALKALLLDVQHDEGYWDFHDGSTPVEMSVQSTAYAVMALLRQGESDAVAAAENAVDWLLSVQLPEGGWYAEGGIGPEFLEMDSEAAWAIKALLDRFSGSVGMTAGYTPQIGIMVDPTWVDFGDVVPGTPSAAQTVTVTNTGTVAEDFSASITNESPAGVYTGYPGLEMDEESVDAWLPTWVAVYGTEVPSLVLTVPTGTAPGTYTAVLVFWAEQAAP